MKAIVITPTYNERENIQELILTLRNEVDHFPRIDILVVDSASPDKTADVVREMQKTDPALYLLTQEAKLGLAQAYLDGMKWALRRNYDCLVTMDADFSHHPRYVNTFLKEIRNQDLLVGSRYVPGGGLKSWSWHRQMLSQFANGYARTLTGLPIADLTSGFHCFRTSLLKQVLRHPIRTEGYAFLIELKFLSFMQGARYLEIPIIFSDRTKGNSKISKKVIWESVFFVLKLARQRKRLKKFLKVPSS